MFDSGFERARSILVIPGLSPGVSPKRVRVLLAGHHAYQLYAHVTWHTWKRVGCVNRSAARDVIIAVGCAARRTSTIVLRSAVLADHVHVLVSFRPDTRLSDFVRLAKTIAAFRANRRVPGAVKWARGFYVASLHKTILPAVDRYIADQYDRHPDRIPRPDRGSS